MSISVERRRAPSLAQIPDQYPSPFSALFLRGYTFKAGSYIYVNSPTISRSEWHPFSIIEVPGKTPKAAFYAEAVSSLLSQLLRALKWRRREAARELVLKDRYHICH